LDLLPFARPFYLMNIFPGPHHQEDPVREIAATPQINVVASLVVGADTSTIPSGNTPPSVDKIKLEQESMELVQI
jgi:hypothetical protein